MSDLRLSGLATGLDTRALITQLMAFERRPVNLMEQAQAKTRSKIDMYRQINTRLVSLQRAAEKVMAASFNAAVAASASSSDPTRATALITGATTAGTYNLVVNSLAKKQITGLGAFTTPMTGMTISDPTRFGATLGPGAASGTFNVDILSVAKAQITGNGVFNAPATTLTNSNPTRLTATADSTAASGTYNVTVNALARAQISGGGAFNAPALSATSSSTARISAPTATSEAAFGVNTYSLARMRTFTAQITTGTGNVGGAAATATQAGDLTITKGGVTTTIAVTAGMTIADVRAAITGSAAGVTASMSGTRLRFTGNDGDSFTVGGSTAALRTWLGIGGTTNNQTAQLARVRIGAGADLFSADNTFTAAETGLTGVSFNVASTSNTATTLTVTNYTGTLEIVNNATGTATPVVITGAMTTPAAVASAINAANTGMTASVNGAGRLELTANDTGVAYTIRDAGGGNALATRLGLTPTIQTSALASISVNGGAAITSTTNSFNDPVTGIDMTAVALGSTTLTVTNNTGTLRITNDSTGVGTNVAITSGMTAANVASAINAANTGMTASVNGSGRLELTGNATGVSYTIADAGGGNTLATALGIASGTHTIQAADQARMTVNGGPVVSSTTNQITGGIPGITINALAPGAATLTVTAGAGSLRITNTTAGGFKDVTIASGSSVTDVANAINGAATGMTASVQGGRLVLTGNQEGDAFTIEDVGGGTTLASSLGIDSATRTTQAASLASISLDGGPAITGTSDTFTGAIPGVSIQALAVGSTTLAVTAGSGTAGADGGQKQLTLNAIKELVTSFNDTMKFIKDNSSYDTATKKAGLLLGDSMAANLRSGLTRMFNEVVDDQGVYRTAHSVGIQLQRDGTLALDEARLKQALEDDSAAFKTLFTNEDNDTWDDAYGVAIKANTLGATGSMVAGDGIANRLKAYVDTMVANASQYNATDGTGRHARGTLLTRIDSAESVIKETDRRIESYLNRLAKRQKVMEAKFAAMEKLVTMMRNQGNYMASQYIGMAQNNQ